MKCIYCETDSTKRERTDGTCKKCHRKFAFEPTDMKVFPVTDKAFQAAIMNVSENGTLFYTPRQLYYQLIRPKTKPKDIKIGGASGGCWNGTLFILFVISFIVGVVANSILIPVIGLALALGLGIIVSAMLPRPHKVKKLPDHPPINYQFFKSALLDRWINVHGMPPKILPEGGRLRPALRNNQSAPDLQQYSFDRLLVVDKAETADMLLANNLHFETNTPIVSVDGYPQDVFENVMGMVRRNPNLKIFCLHDADPEGCLLPLRLREDSRWFPDARLSVLDMGLRPKTLANLAFMRITKVERRDGKLPMGLVRALSPGERRWLEAGNRGELAALKPSHLLKSVFQTFRKALEEEQRLRAVAVSDQRSFFQTHLPGVPLAYNPVYNPALPAPTVPPPPQAFTPPNPPGESRPPSQNPPPPPNSGWPSP